jgi:hypothetical protein
MIAAGFNLPLSRRRQTLILAAGLCAGMGLARVGPVGAAEPVPSPANPASLHGPVLAIAATAQDGGTVEAGTVLKFHFAVANHGETELQIPQVKPSCGCTVPHWDKAIAPGKEGVIDAEVNTTAFRGPITKHLTAFTNDPAHAQLELVLTAKVTPLIDVKPGPSALLAVDDKPVTQEFTLERTGGQAMKVLQVSRQLTEEHPVRAGHDPAV